MSRNRVKPGAGWAYEKALPRGPSGRALCRQCGQEVPRGRRRTFCSDVCVHEWKVRTDPGYVRRVVFERDRGVCAVCGIDAEALRYELRSLTRGLSRAAREEVERRWKRERGIPRHRREFWDADHIVPVIEGGGECDLDNYRTLCIPCHQRVTADLAARRAAANRPAEEPSPQLPLFGEENT